MDASSQNQRTHSQGGLVQVPMVRKSQLSPARRWLVEEMQALGYGQIKQLVVIKGEPVQAPAPKISQRCRLTGPRRRPCAAPSEDCILKEQVVNLFAELDQMANGVVALLEVRDGLPCDMTLE